MVTTSNSMAPGLRRMPLSRSLPKTSGLPCSTINWLSSAAPFSVNEAVHPVIVDDAVLEHLDERRALVGVGAGEDLGQVLL